MRQALEILAQSIVGIWILAMFGIYMIVGCILGALLIPYNIARIATWILEKMVEGVAFIAFLIEEQL